MRTRPPAGDRRSRHGGHQQGGAATRCGRQDPREFVHWCRGRGAWQCPETPPGLLGCWSSHNCTFFPSPEAHTLTGTGWVSSSFDVPLGLNRERHADPSVGRRGVGLPAALAPLCRPDGGPTAERSVAHRLLLGQGRPHRKPRTPHLAACGSVLLPVATVWCLAPLWGAPIFCVCSPHTGVLRCHRFSKRCKGASGPGRAGCHPEDCRDWRPCPETGAQRPKSGAGPRSLGTYHLVFGAFFRHSRQTDISRAWSTEPRGSHKRASLRVVAGAFRHVPLFGAIHRRSLRFAIRFLLTDLECVRPPWDGGEMDSPHAPQSSTHHRRPCGHGAGAVRPLVCCFSASRFFLKVSANSASQFCFFPEDRGAHPRRDDHRKHSDDGEPRASLGLPFLSLSGRRPPHPQPSTGPDGEPPDADGWCLQQSSGTNTTHISLASIIISPTPPHAGCVGGACPLSVAPVRVRGSGLGDGPVGTHSHSTTHRRPCRGFRDF